MMGELRKFGKQAKLGLVPKKDLVSKYWEDDLSQVSLRTALKKLPKEYKSKLRVLELGSARGDSYPFLMSIPHQSGDLENKASYCLQADQVELFLGLESDYAQVEKANERFIEEKKVRFICSNLSKGFELIEKAEAPFQLYLTRAGSLSYLSRDAVEALLSKVLQHAPPQGLLNLEFKGKYSLAHEPTRINTPYIKTWSGEEVQELIARVEAESGRKLKLIKQWDRSIFVAQHTEKVHSESLSALRTAVNQLLEKDTRTTLSDLLIPESLPAFAQPKVARFYTYLRSSWNYFIQYAEHRFQVETKPQELKDWNRLPQSLQFGLMTLDRLLQDTQWISYGDRRANLIEPHIAYVLRSLEYDLEQGLGCGEDLCCILQLEN